MSRYKGAIYREKLTPYLQNLLKKYEVEYGKESCQYNAIALQYLKSPKEDNISEYERTRHYDADMHIKYKGAPIKGVERLYRRTILIEPTAVCAAHCRWCLRGNYMVGSLQKKDLDDFAEYCGSDSVSHDLKEILITGGDPFMIPDRLKYLLVLLKQHATNLEIFRIASRIPVQDPDRVNKHLLECINVIKPKRIEIATQINHVSEISSEAREAYNRLQNEGYAIYNQSVLLKNVNDSKEALIELYDCLRYLGIESHYLFHCVPMKGMSHHRTSVHKGLNLIMEITSSGYFSGRAKPMYTVMTDIGKITLYQDSILKKNEKNMILLQTRYTAKNFRERNPSWKLPDSAYADENGFLRVWYLDGMDDL